jgi:hypothetical protein
MAESSLALICACLPTLGPLFLYRERSTRGTGKSNGYSLNTIGGTGASRSRRAGDTNSIDRIAGPMGAWENMGSDEDILAKPSRAEVSQVKV